MLRTYAYARNSPLLAADRDGHSWHVADGAAIGSLMRGAIEARRQYLAGGSVSNWGRAGAAASGGAASGAIVEGNPESYSPATLTRARTPPDP